MNLVGRLLVPLLTFTFLASARCEFITIGAIGALSGLGYYAYDTLKCKYQECCTDDYIKPDLDSEWQIRNLSSQKKGSLDSPLSQIEKYIFSPTKDSDLLFSIKLDAFVLFKIL